MSSKPQHLPSPIYVFVVISLAAFLTLFTLWRRPQTQYVAQVVLPRAATTDSGDRTTESIRDLRAKLLRPQNVLDALQHAGMIAGDANAEMLEIAGEIASRMRMTEVAGNTHSSVKLLLATEHPSVGAKLLDQMVIDHYATPNARAETNLPSAVASRVRGVSIGPSSLVLLLLCSALVGIGGLMLLEQSKETAVLLTEEQVTATSHLPVLADFTRDINLPPRTRKLAWRRRFGAAVRVAEIAIAAAIVLMVYNIATHKTFSDLIVRDPLSAYSEAVGRILG